MIHWTSRYIMMIKNSNTTDKRHIHNRQNRNKQEFKPTLTLMKYRKTIAESKTTTLVLSLLSYNLHSKIRCIPFKNRYFQNRRSFKAIKLSLSLPLGSTSGQQELCFSIYRVSQEKTVNVWFDIS